MKIRKSAAGAAIFAGLLLVAGCGGEELTEIRGASVVPASVAAFVAIGSIRPCFPLQWRTTGVGATRAPMQDGDFSRTAMSVRTLIYFATPARRATSSNTPGRPSGAFQWRAG